MDLMEVPSHVVERFASSPAVLKSCMRHHISGRPMGSAMVGDLQRSQGFFDGLNLHQQVHLAALSYVSVAGSGPLSYPCYHVLLSLRLAGRGCWDSTSVAIRLQLS